MSVLKYAISAGVGALLSHVITKRYFVTSLEKKYQKQCDEECQKNYNELDAYYKKKYGAVTKLLDEGKDIIVENGNVSEVVPDEKLPEEVRTMLGSTLDQGKDLPKREPIDYTKFYAGNNVETKDVDSVNLPDYEYSFDASIKKANEDEYDHKSVYVYLDGVVADDSGVVVDDYTRFIGDICERMKAADEEHGVVYNNAEMCRYDVESSTREYFEGRG